MTLFQVFGAAWIATLVALIAMLIHRTIVGFREDDQLFLASGEADLERQQVKLSTRLDKLTRTIHSLAYISSAMLVVMVSISAWRVLSDPISR